MYTITRWEAEDFRSDTNMQENAKKQKPKIYKVDGIYMSSGWMFPSERLS